MIIGERLKEICAKTDNKEFWVNIFCNSYGGGSIYGFYLEDALHPSDCTAPQEILDKNLNIEYHNIDKETGLEIINLSFSRNNEPYDKDESKLIWFKEEDYED